MQLCVPLSFMSGWTVYVKCIWM